MPIVGQLIAGKQHIPIDIKPFVEPNLVSYTSQCTDNMPTITYVEGPDGSKFQDAHSHLTDDGPDAWHYSFPANGYKGVGFLVDPLVPQPVHIISDFAMHDHKYQPSAPDVPVPERATVYYKFSSSVEVYELEVIQHPNGIFAVNAFAGSSKEQTNIPLGEAQSIAQGFVDGQADLFRFSSPASGSWLKVVVTRTKPGGWAVYRMFPRDKFGRRFIPAAQSFCSP